MFFQVNLTPTEKICTKKINENAENKDPVNRYTLILAPFQPQTHIVMEAKINTTSQSFLTLKNITQNCLKLTVTKQPPPDRHLLYNATDFKIEGNDETVLEITWRPEKDGIFRDVLELTDNRRIKYNITLNLTVKDPQRVVKSRKVLAKKLKKSSNNLHPPVLTVSSYNSRNLAPKSSNFGNFAGNTAHSVKRTLSPIKCEPNKENIEFDFEESITKLQTTRTKRIKKQDYPVHDFSTLVNTKFQLSPFNPKSLPGQSKPDKVESSCTENILTQQFHTQETLRRETFDVPPDKNVKCTQILDDSNQHTDKSQCRSDFSFIVNQVNFSTVQTPQNNKFSPKKCSTVIKNKTYNLTTDDKSDNSSSSFNSNATYDLSDSCQKNLKANFDVLSSIEKSPEKHLSPVKTSNNFNLSFKNSPSKCLDQTAKSIIEADLWATSEPSVSFSVHQTFGQLSKIVEEESLNKTFISPIKRYRRGRPLKMEISPPIKSVHKLGVLKTISPRKKCKLTRDKLENTLRRKVQINKNTTASNLDISGVKITKTSGLIKKKDDFKREKIIKLTDSKDIISRLCTPDPFSATTTEDPFLSSIIYYDAKWIHQQEIEFTKWLNALMTAPEHLSTDVDAEVVDIGKVWQSCRQKEDVILAETKETISLRYHTDTKLNTLRKAACALFRNQEVEHVLLHTNLGIEKGIFVVRKDRNLHKDIGLQKTILELFLSYNPLWLRITLETVYNEKIPLHSNNDLVGLTRFLLARFFSDPHLIKEHSFSVSLRRPSFFVHLNKFILQKFLFMIYFLDYAKNRKLIGHDPCLFRKKSLIKDSRSILLAFSREVLSGIGDITKVLRGYGYIVTHKQTCLDEYDYAVIDLSSDLRDGVKLCRTMEIITNKNELIQKCRVPAISRLQKIHNVEIALKALKIAGYELIGDIDAKSIVDGHREKTLSLLWQIIYKFLKPLFEKAAIKLQRWWRAKLWPIRIRNMLKRRNELAATVIQTFWRRHLAMKKTKLIREERERELKLYVSAAFKIQKFWRQQQQRLRQMELEKVTKIVQKRWRDIQNTKPYVQQYRKDRNAVIALQRRWKAKRLMKVDRKNFLNLRESAITVQRRWRAKCSGERARLEYLNMKKRVIYLQQKWRAKKMSREERKSFLQKVQAAKILQAWWKATLARKRDRNNFLILKGAVRTLEDRWIARAKMLKDRENYLKMRKSAIVIQRSWRRYAATKAEIALFRQKRKAIILIQKWYRNRKACRPMEKLFQKSQRAARAIQSWWSRSKVAKKERQNFVNYKNAVIKIQKRWKETALAKKEREQFLKKKWAIIEIQSQWKMLKARKKFSEKKQAAKCIQNWWRRELFMKQRINACKKIQNIWKATLLMRKQRQEFLKEKRAAIKIQSFVRMAIASKEFTKKRNAAIILQKHWRTTLKARQDRIAFLRQKKAAIKIQSYFKMHKCAEKYRQRQKAVRKIQGWWRSECETKRLRSDYLSLKSAAITVQKRFKDNRLRRKYRMEYLRLKKGVIQIQREFRAKQLLRQLKLDRLRYETESKEHERFRMHQAATKIQAFWRGYRVRMLAPEQVIDARRRTMRATKNAASKSTIANKVDESVIILKNPNSVGQLICCLYTLDTVTRLSPDSCISLCEMGMVVNIYDVMTRYNRSLPLKDACLGATNILINLTKFARTVHHVTMIEYAEILTHILAATCEKQLDLFFPIATLIWLLTNEDYYAEEIVQHPQIMWWLKKVHSTMAKVKHKPSSERPSILPDWNFNRHPRLFSNSHRAISMIYENLNMR